MSKPRLCVDIDNVIAGTDEVIRGVIREFTHGQVDLFYQNVTEFDYWQCADQDGRGITKQDWGPIHELFSDPDRILAIGPLPGARAGLERLASEFQVHLVTSRLAKAHGTTCQWLRKHGFPYDGLHFVPHREKHLCLGHVAAAVEDDYEQGVAFGRAGVPCCLLQHPWNTGKPHRPRIQWARDWAQVVAMIAGSSPDTWQTPPEQ